MDLDWDDLREIARDLLAPAVAQLMDAIDDEDWHGVVSLAAEVEHTATAVRRAYV
jgi:predicted DNA-binding ribbon-helix-helix protein